MVAQAGTEYALMKTKIKEVENIIELNPPENQPVEQGTFDDDTEPDMTPPILTPKRREPKKVVMIILNDLFKKSKQLPGLKKTFANLIRLFERDMIVKDDLVLKIHNGSKKDILQELHKITARKDFISYSMFMCFIATHGNLECFHTSDENTVTYHELFGLVSQKEWKDFKDKPKIFFIDNCRTRMDKRGLYPKDLQIEELSTHELAVKWNPPEFFEHFELNYLVNVYEIDQNRISVKRHEILSLEPSCLLRDLNSKTIYKISVWPVLAKTQKKKGWPNHTKYMIHDIEDRNEIQMVASSTNSITFSWWLNDDVEGQRFIAKCRKKTGGDNISEELDIVEGKQQTHMIGYLSSNTAYLIGVYIGSVAYLPEVEFKTKAKLQPQNLKLVKVESFQIDVAWEPPAQDYYGISHYLVEYRSKFIVDFVQVSAIPTLKNYECKLTGMEPDVLYKIRIFAEKDKGKGDPTDLIKCRTPKVDINRTGLEPRDANFFIAYNDSLTGTGKGTDGWFINAVLKHLRNRYLQSDLEDIVQYVLEDIPKRQKKKSREPVIISTLNSKVNI
uniref:Receptor-type tyrosine-protein phosphatase F-like isoform X2 n=1 Tax=Crassostrea virginica TaxID=6565 RepID=A0A8B8CE14_CRAVI|nr:receptor-type tyrosine-protein phosphatase F-like isoform X2 [Crassostrea virginica]